MRWRTFGLTTALTCGLLLTCPQARADAASPPSSVPPDSLAAFERDNPDCAEYGNGCQTCKRSGQEVACSNPPIACVQDDRWLCRKRMETQQAPQPSRP